jgi:hypothetical protein
MQQPYEILPLPDDSASDDTGNLSGLKTKKPGFFALPGAGSHGSTGLRERELYRERSKKSRRYVSAFSHNHKGLQYTQ